MDNIYTGENEEEKKEKEEEEEEEKEKEDEEEEEEEEEEEKEKEDEEEESGGGIKGTRKKLEKRGYILHKNAPPLKNKLDYSEMKKYISKYYKNFKWDNIVFENKCIENIPDLNKKDRIIKFNKTQDFISTYFNSKSPYNGILLWHSVGTGKCHAINTPILMYDGSIKKVQDINEGDNLMGDDSTPRKVLTLARGRDKMYDITDNYNNKYTVNSEHILVLKYKQKGYISNKYRVNYFDIRTLKNKSKLFKSRIEAIKYLKLKNRNNIVEIEVNKFLKLPKNIQNNFTGIQNAVYFPTKEINFDPYIIGLYINSNKINTNDEKILNYINNYVKNNNINIDLYKYNISNNTNKIDLSLNYILYEYKCNNKYNRLQLLAGIIDNSGYYSNINNIFIINSKSSELADDILYLARSLGYISYIEDNKIIICGNNLINIPVKSIKIPNKYFNNTNNIYINDAGIDNYYGFTLNGNNRYILGNFLVTHNTCSAIATASKGFEENGYTILWVTRHTLKPDIWKNMFNSVCSVVLQKKIEEGKNVPSKNVKNPLKYLSDRWKMPMSYKQFTNLLSKKNNLYKDLENYRNNEKDPLKKTLVIIDEAHKLFSNDLPVAERPNIKVLKDFIKSSYNISKENSVKLLLMTATPYTNNPMDLIKLINIMKEEKDELPEDFDLFKDKFLDDKYKFTENGKNDYLNSISGYISYLNREKDARQFAIPTMHNISVNMSNNDSDINNKKDPVLSQETAFDKCLGIKTKVICPSDKEINPISGRCVKKCSEDKIRDLETGKCVKINKDDDKEIHPITGKLVKKCPENKIRDLETGKCVEINKEDNMEIHPITGKLVKKCPKNKIRDLETGKCIEINKEEDNMEIHPITGKLVKKCPKYKIRDLETGKCIKDTENKEIHPITGKLVKKCPENKIRDLKTGKCIEIKDEEYNEDKEINPITGRLVKKCPENKIRDLETGKCIKKIII